MTDHTTAVRTILVATDFSPTAGAAARWASSLARLHGAKVVVVHALAPPIPPAGSPDFVALPPDYELHFRQAAEQRLLAVASEIQAAGPATTSELLIGPSAATVLEAATKHAADVIVVGTRGLTGFRHLLLGSTAERIVHAAKVPVLVVHPQDPNGARRLRTVLVPTDFSEDAAYAVRAAQRILHAAEPGARLLLLHAYHLPVEFTALGTMPVTPTLFADAQEQARKHLEEMAKPLRDAGLAVDTVAREGYAPTVIEEVARTEAVDLIAMGTHGRSGLQRLLLGSTAERVVQHAPCPVLVVHREG